MLTNDTTPNSGHTSDRLNDGERFYNLSDKTPQEAETVWQALSSFVTNPFLMPDGTIRRPPGQASDRLSTSDIQLACATRATLERMQARLRESENVQFRTAADLVDEASLYLGIAISGQ